uniref:Guanine nucleotide-binding protein subunit beta-like protein n=1 Tax=Favella ehrenbergii TaxID=182087 RepID=A0A7S3I2G0_9SPIT|eukprot:CAMPEP_0170462100 /NCGR_PEP_ID=MMETSP0123-20130129/7737_1 /TAXON_ID=182087 /ORGANISM="Favella ehrenbergii, Strain Fehren 1" /LENGTH=340 /DNA_ID=CAMNT_0010727245 /DNA_START=38 /DNA_END=1060 /DNA_ORIENTATION=+
MAEESKTQHRLRYRGYMRGHGGWVTSLSVGEEEVNGERQEFLMSGSRDKTLIKWNLTPKKDEDEDKEWGVPRRMMTGHSHFISEIKLTGDSRFAFSASWDGSVRLWNVASGRTISKLIGHKKDVLSVALSSDDRQIITGSLDKDIKIWNTRSECKFTVDKNNHTDAVSVVRFYHAKKPALCVTASWDKTIKVWDNLYMTLLHTFCGHKAQVTTLDIVENSAFLASGSRDGTIMVWDIVQGKWFTKHDCDSPVNSVLFSQKLYWLVIATQTGIKVLNLPEQKFVQEEIRATSMKQNEGGSTKLLSCTSMAWSKNGQILYTGWTDNHIRVYEIDSSDSGSAE